MKWMDKRFWVFEALMVACGVLAVGWAFVVTVWIPPVWLLLLLVVWKYPLGFLGGGIVAWKVAGDSGYWRLVGWGVLFFVLMGRVMDVGIFVLWVLRGMVTGGWWDEVMDLVQFGFMLACFDAVVGVLPVMLGCWVYKLVEKRWMPVRTGDAGGEPAVGCESVGCGLKTMDDGKDG